MYLSKLEILGFKSFANRTVVNFNQGMTGIVGPNGCGKTNIVDAIRWSLGEQKSSTLRSDKMESVIFNGTANKKPLGMAEVSLTIQNDKGILPSEYTEVVITRRIFRSGESEYLLNRNLCRLKDITNLFMDTGMGANAYSVIELKMVESILSPRTEERRILFEEAAGVNKYKLRRRLTIKRLEEVKAEMTRVSDIVSEVEKKVASLERQAKRADKYNSLSKQLRELEFEFSERRLALLAGRREELKNEREGYFKRKLEVDSELNRLEDEVKAIKEELNEIERRLSAKRQEKSVKTEKVFSLQRSISVSEERRKSLLQNIEWYKSELKELNEQIEIANESIEEHQSRINDIEALIAQKTAEKEQSSALVKERGTSVENKKTEIAETSKHLLEQVRTVTAKENELANLDKTIERLKQSIQRLETRAAQNETTGTGLAEALQQLQQQKAEAETNLRNAEEANNAGQEEFRRLEKEIAEYREKEIEGRTLLNGVKERVEFLSNLIENLEGFSQGSRLLLEHEEWAVNSKSLLAHIGNTSEQYRLAVEAAIKENLNNIIVESLEEVKKGIGYLLEHSAGKASFYVNAGEIRKRSLLEKAADWLVTRKMKKIEQTTGFVGWTYNLIDTDDKWKSFFRQLFSRHVVVDTLDTALELHRHYPEFSFTALNGDSVYPSGVIEAGSPPKADDTLFGRKQILETLRAELPEREAAIEAFRNEIQTRENLLTGIDLKALADAARVMLSSLGEIEKQIAQNEYEQTKVEAERQRLSKELEDARKQLEAVADEKANAALTVSDLQNKRIEAGKAKEAMDAVFSTLEKELRDANARLNAANIDLERLTGEKRNAENALNRNRETIVQITRTIEKRGKDISEATDESAALEGILDDYHGDLAEAESEREVIAAEEKKIDEQYKEVRGTINGLEETQRALRKERDTLSSSMHSLDIKLQENTFTTETLQKHIFENYSGYLELKEFDDLHLYDFVGKESELNTLRQQIKNLGQINHMAYEEYEEEKTRLEFLQKQYNDLLGSEKDLINTIDEINKTAQNLFLETFGKIRENFIDIFRSLFNPGDEADLKLEEDVDPLEGKIEIIAKPKGKRPATIESLSGGEKTLTAIALLFAIYLVKPSPFCILDEIDAPLDDANIDRFSNILRRFSKNTQFIVVTHNKRTMEATDTLYGVTMQEEGISKIVSVRFNEELNLTE